MTPPDSVGSSVELWTDWESARDKILRPGTATENKFSLRVIQNSGRETPDLQIYSSQVQGGYFSAASYFSLKQVEDKQKSF